jgi:hypothetical protein
MLGPSVAGDGHVTRSDSRSWGSGAGTETTEDPKKQAEANLGRLVHDGRTPMKAVGYELGMQTSGSAQKARGFVITGTPACRSQASRCWRPSTSRTGVNCRWACLPRMQPVTWPLTLAKPSETYRPTRVHVMVIGADRRLKQTMAHPRGWWSAVGGVLCLV